MNDLNVFIIEILTIDYSYFWSAMGVGSLVDEEGRLISNDSYQEATDRKNLIFVPFSDSPIGLEYVQEFSDREIPSAFSSSVLECAITAILFSSRKQMQMQVSRFYNIRKMWEDDFEVGIDEASMIYEAFSCSEEELEKDPYQESLESYCYVAESHGIIHKNLPKGIKNIYLNKEFCRLYRSYVLNKIIALGKLISATGIEPDFSSKQNKSQISIHNTADSVNLDIHKTEITAPVIAMVCVYLAKAGLFKVGSLKSHFEKYILPKYSYSYNSLSNDYYKFRNDDNRLKKYNIEHIERAIKILPEFDLIAPILLAEADLKVISEKTKAN